MYGDKILYVGKKILSLTKTILNVANKLFNLLIDIYMMAIFFLAKNEIVMLEVNYFFCRKINNNGLG